jgi:hypothetical protein
MAESLNLIDVLDRDDVTLPNGTKLYLRQPREFGVRDDTRLRILIRKIQEKNAETVADDEAAAEAQADEAADLLHELVRMIVVDPPAGEEIPDWVCVRIFQWWLERAGAPVGDGGADPQRSRRTTGASSRGSRRSTAATPKRGSTSRATS